MSGIFHFSGSYDLDAPSGPVLEALRDAESWPTWWPQVRSVEQLDDVSGLVAIRSMLPITLRLRLISLVDDVAGGVLRAGLQGDLDGWIEMRVRATGSAATQVTYEQECTVAKPGLGRVSSALRPALTLNHAAMMRAGMRGLAAHARAA